MDLTNLPLRHLLFAAASASAALLATALIAQFGFDLHPCELCVAQRWPYVAIILLALPSAYFITSLRRLWVVGFLCALLFAFDAGIAWYHAGVESGLFPGPTACTNTGGQGQTIEEMRRAIMNAPLVSCDQAMIHVFGLSMAAWNGIAASFLAAATLLLLIRSKRT